MLLKWLLALVLIAHGIGHITGVSAFWTKLPMGFNQNPWIFGAGGNSFESSGADFRCGVAGSDRHPDCRWRRFAH